MINVRLLEAQPNADNSLIYRDAPTGLSAFLGNSLTPGLREARLHSRLQNELFFHTTDVRFSFVHRPVADRLKHASTAAHAYLQQPYI